MAKTSFLSKTQPLFLSPWPAVWAWIFFVNLTLGLFAPDNIILMCVRVGGIILCFAYSIIRFPKDHLLQFALLATSIADILLAINNTGELGLFIFVIAQVIHLIRLDRDRDFLIPIIILCCISLVTIIGNFYFHNVDLIFIICSFYLATLLMNIYFSYQWHLRQPRSPYAFFATIGFALFLCCDICTAVSYLSLNHLIAATLYVPANYLAWFFYYPSQVLISNSSNSTQTRESMLK